MAGQESKKVFILRHIKKYYHVALVFGWLLTYSQPMMAAVKNYTEAKNTARHIWQDHRETFYCGCAYNKQGVINYSSCDFKPKNTRKNRYITWEHVVPVSWLGKDLPCWKGEGCVSKNGKTIKGRNCCRKKDKKFRQMEADLHNLVPEIGELNQARQNYRFTSDMQYPSQAFAGCEMLIDDVNERVVAPLHLRGTIARIHLYMSKKYGIVLNAPDRKQFEEWHQQYGPDAWEKKWNEKVTHVQGSSNEFIQ